MRTLSIRTYLLLLVLTVALPLVSIVGLFIYFDIQQTIINTKNTQRTMTRAMVTNTGVHISYVRQILESLSLRSQIRQLNPHSCDSILKSVLVMNSDYINVAYTNMDGVVVCSAVGQPGGKLVNIGKSAWFKKLLKDQKFSVGDPFMGPITGKRVSVISEPLWSDDHKMIGGIQLPLDLNFYNPQIPTEWISDSSRFGFFSDDGVLIWRNSDPENSIGTKPNSEAAKQIVKIKNGEFENIGLDGIKRYYSVVSMPDTHWIAYFGIPTSEVLAAAKHRAMFFVSLVILTVILLLLFARAIARRIAGPIVDLEKVANSIGSGDTQIRAIASGPLEVYSVAHALNSMIEKQQRSNERLNTAQSISRLGSFEWNPVTGDLQWSDEHYRLWGIEPGSIVPTYELFRQAIHSDDVGQVEKNMLDAMQERHLFTSEFRISRPDGTEYYMMAIGNFTFDKSGQAIKLIGTVQDITERKYAEVAIHESEERFRYMLDSCPTAARIARKGGHEIVFFNPRYAELINKSTSEVHGTDPASYYVDQDEYNRILHSIANGEQIFERLVELNIPGEGRKWVLASYLHIQYKGAESVLGWFHDITETIQVERMKSEFISTVSHELRTPLTSISGALGLISGGVLGEMPGQAKLMVDIAHKNSLRLASLINDLLDIDKLVAGKFEIDLQQQSLMTLIQQALESIKYYGEQYKVSFKLIAEENVQVFVDGERLIQVLNNLLSNAAKFSQQGGQVEIAVRRANAAIRVEIIDHGIGIPASFHKRIFHKFAQADSSDTRKKGGTGLGLSISKELIEHMHGTIGFDSIEGKGTCFYIELPL